MFILVQLTNWLFFLLLFIYINLIYYKEGTKENPGVNMRALNELFRVAQERAADYKFEITVSVLEIYNETIHDLLVKPPKGNAPPVKYPLMLFLIDC